MAVTAFDGIRMHVLLAEWTGFQEVPLGCLTSDYVFFGSHAKSESFASEGASGAFIRKAIWLEANLNVKRQMSESRPEPPEKASRSMQDRVELM